MSKQIPVCWKKYVGCGVCTTLCPMGNLSVENQMAVHHNRCTMCYRCISHCQHQAITLLGDTLHEQCRIENYL